MKGQMDGAVTSESPKQRGAVSVHSSSWGDFSLVSSDGQVVRDICLPAGSCESPQIKVPMTLDSAAPSPKSDSNSSPVFPSETSICVALGL